MLSLTDKDLVEFEVACDSELIEPSAREKIIRDLFGEEACAYYKSEEFRENISRLKGK